jgi:uridylate kinase
MKSLLIKISGELLRSPEICEKLCKQIITLSQKLNIGLVIGGGNIFRARKEGEAYKLQQPIADTIGMIATIANGLIIYDTFLRLNRQSVILSAIDINGITQPISPLNIIKAKNNKNIIIFTGGTGNPFFTTDTNAIVRACQIGAQTVIKLSTVDYIYDKDPAKYSNCTPIYHLTYDEMLSKGFTVVLDNTAITLAKEHNIKIIFCNGTKDNILNKIINRKETKDKNKKYWSTISS